MSGWRRRIRVLVVDDSLTVRRHIAEVLSEDPVIEVVGEAANGREAVDLCLALRPDVVTLDVVMPVMDGLEATERIMSLLPTPIVVVSSAENRGELLPSFDALAAGAVEVVDKPRGDETDDDWAKKLRSTVRTASRVLVMTRFRHPGSPLAGATPRRSGPGTPSPWPGALDPTRHREPPPAALLTPPVPSAFSSFPADFSARTPCLPEVVALAASTGGPRVLVEVLCSLPSTFPLPILVVLHLADPFAAPFADWLGRQVRLPVRFAQNGEPIPGRGSGAVILAPPNLHLEVYEKRFVLSRKPERHAVRPSADVLFESLAMEFGQCVIAGVLTGMGRDGASGLLALRKAGARTFAQDESSSTVFGMPREAIQLGAAELVLPSGSMGAALTTLARGRIGKPESGPEAQA